MRDITISLDEDLLRAVERQAARRGMSPGRLIEGALREAFPVTAEEGQRRSRIKLPTSGHGGTFPGIDISDSKSLWDLEDEERYGRVKLR